MKYIEFEKFEQTGRINRDRNVFCQDKTHINYINGVASISLADGAGSCKFAECGAFSASKNIHQYMSNNFDRFLQMEEKYFMRKFIARELIYTMDMLTKELNCEMKDLGSTLLYAGSDGNQIIILHLGDGWIVGVDGDEATIISEPENDTNQYYTYLTSSTNMELYLRVKIIPIKKYSQIMLCSDGFPLSEYLVKCKKKYSTSIARCVDTQPQKIMQNYDAYDDVAYVSMKIK